MSFNLYQNIITEIPLARLSEPFVTDKVPHIRSDAGSCSRCGFGYRRRKYGCLVKILVYLVLVLSVATVSGRQLPAALGKVVDAAPWIHDEIEPEDISTKRRK